MRTTRCKFRCLTVTQSEGDREHPVVYGAKFAAVVSGSPENESFFKWTPSGTMDLAVYREDVFKPGKEYYLDITEAA